MKPCFMKYMASYDMASNMSQVRSYPRSNSALDAFERHKGARGLLARNVAAQPLRFRETKAQDVDVRQASDQGLTLVHFSAQCKRLW